MTCTCFCVIVHLHLYDFNNRTIERPPLSYTFFDNDPVSEIHPVATKHSTLSPSSSETDKYHVKQGALRDPLPVMLLN